jgi:Arylsulfotransferase (ASST)
MKAFFGSFFLLIGLSSAVNGQSKIFPADKDTLNFTQVKFSIPKSASDYTYQWKIKKSSGDSILFTNDINEWIFDQLEFGKSYQWSYQLINKKNKVIYQSSNFSFYIASSDFTSNVNYRYTVNTKTLASKFEGYLIMDKARSVVSRNGNLIWYLPISKTFPLNADFRDLKMTSEGTFTCINDSFAYEIDIRGNVIWQAPLEHNAFGIKREQYHHDFKKLPNGNFMVLGKYWTKRVNPYNLDTTDIILGTILEFDKNKNVVWKWNSNDYFMDKDLFVNINDTAYKTDTHLNAFSTDGEYVYAGFRDKSRLIKIQKSTGKVIATYGYNLEATKDHFAPQFFRRQHDATLLQNGSLAVFNNDSVMIPGVFSSLVVFSQPKTPGEDSKLELNLSMKFDELATGKCLTGGNVEQLKNGNYLVCLGANNRSVEISPSGKKIWDMLFYQFNQAKNRWDPFPQYRTFYTDGLYNKNFQYEIVKKSRIKEGWRISVKVWNIHSKKQTFSFYYKGKQISPSNNTEIDPNLSKAFDLIILDGKLDIKQLQVLTQ